MLAKGRLISILNTTSTIILLQLLLQLMEKWEGTLVNLGHCYRKKGQYDDAIRAYEQAIGLCPRRSSSFAALAFTYHLQGSLDVAIEYYHR